MSDSFNSANTAVLLSIRPEWTRLILTRKKTLEVRKNRPAIEPPFTCYIYCTHGRYEGVKVIPTLETTKEWSGHIIGEFVCDSVSHYPMPESLNNAKACRDFWAKALLKTSVLLEYCSDVRETLYGQYKRSFHSDLYGWSISGLHIYKKPLFLSVLSNLIGEPVKRAPQSWMYVERL